MQTKEPVITVLSSFAKDIFIDTVANTTYSRLGGPALFIKEAFERERLPYTLITGDQLEVEILLSPGSERGRIMQKIEEGIPPAIKTDAILISTVLNEWPMGIKNFKGLLFIDIQGFVRDGESFGAKRKIEIENGFSPFCIKATAEELVYLPAAFISDQKSRCLIVTQGKNGSQIFFKGSEYEFAPKEIIAASDTIGAGDTFFAHLVARFLKTRDVVASGKWATEQTARFLDQKPKAH